MNPVLELRDVRLRVAQADILRGISLSVSEGERVAVIGPNGAGKTTLFDAVSGRRVPSSGQILLKGRRIDGCQPFEIHRRGLARSFQITSLFDRLSVRDNLRCAALRTLGVHGALLWHGGRFRAADARADELLALLGLQARRELRAADLTYAEQRALEIGVTLAGASPVILLDEPTSGMSRSEAGRFVELIRRASAGRTLLLVEHDMSVVFELADRVAVLDAGELIAFGAPQAVRDDPRVQQAYLGASYGARSA